MSQIMKAILAMENNEIPATIGIKRFNPAIDFAGARVKVVTETTPWPKDLLRRVSINSFGYGGANAHCIIEHPSVLLPHYQRRGFPLSNTMPTLHQSSTYGHTNGSTTNSNMNGSTTNGHTYGSATNGHTNGSTTNDLTNGISANTDQSNGPEKGETNGIDHPISPDAWPVSASLIPSEQSKARPLVLVPFSAHDDKALEANVTELSKVSSNYRLPDLLYSLSHRKSHFSRRGFLVGDAQKMTDEMKPKSLIRGKVTNSASRRVGFVFTGQGAQWATMGARLIPEYKVVEETISYLDIVLGQLSQKPSWTIMKALEEPFETSCINEPSVSQTVCTALQIALVNLLKEWGIDPVATVGHSSGEIAASYAAGRLKASEAIVLAYFRGQAVAKNTRKGLMLVVGMSVEQLQPYLAGYEQDVKIAAINSFKTVTLSGEVDAIQALATAFAKDNAFHRVLETGYNAYHSHHMSALGEDYEASVAIGLDEVASRTKEETGRPNVPWISTVTPYKEVSSVSPRYWRQNLESPVRFVQAIERLTVDDLVDICVEVGPHSALTSLFKQIRTDMESKGHTAPPCLPSLKRGEHDVFSMLNLAGNLFLNGASINLVAVNASENTAKGKRVLQHGYPCIDLPTYRFTYGDRPLYFENRFNREYRTRKHPRHDLLGARQPGLAHTHPSWRNVLRMRDVRWLEDHKLLPDAVLPAAAYIAMAIEAASQIHMENNSQPIKSFRLRNVAINSTLRVPDDEFGIETVLNLARVSLGTTGDKSTWFQFSIASAAPDSSTWTEHCTGSISVQIRAATLDQDQQLSLDPRSRSLDIDRWYAKFVEVGLGYGPAFQGLSHLKAYHRSNTVGASVALVPSGPGIKEDQSSYVIHPGTLDTCIQLGLIACHAGQVENVQKSFIPVVAGEVTIWNQLNAGLTASAVAHGVFSGMRSVSTRIQMHTTSGHPILDMNSLRLVTFQDSASNTAGSATPTRDPYWRPIERVDIDTLTTESITKLLPYNGLTNERQAMFYKFGALVVSDICKSFDDGPLRKYSESHKPFLDWAESWGSTLDKHTSDLGQEIHESYPQINDIPEVECLSRLHKNIDRILSAETSTMELLLQDGLLEKLSGSGVTFKASNFQLRNILELQAHKDPRMRILQLGGELGQYTTTIMETLAADTPFKRFESLVITDATAWAEAQAKDYVAHLDKDSISYKALDITQEPIPQRFESDYFDLVLDLGSLGVLPDADVALKHIHTLLKPTGKLVMLPAVSSNPGIDVLIRSLQGNWGLKGPGNDEARWETALKSSGFSGIDLVHKDVSYFPSRLLTYTLFSVC